MAPPLRSKPLRKDLFAQAYKPLKPTLFSESLSTTRGPQLVPNIRALSWSATGSLIATCTSAHLRVWSPERPKVSSSVEVRNGHNGVFSSSAASGQTGTSAPGSAAVVERIAFAPTTDYLLASTGGDGGVRLWDVRIPGGAAGAGKGVPLADCKMGDAGFFLTWHPNGTELLAGGRNDVIEAVDVRKLVSMEGDGAISWELQNSALAPAKDKGAFNAMAFSNSGREVFATTQDGAVKILDYPSMTLLHTLSAHTNSSYAAQQSPRGDWLAVGGGDGIITLWDTGTWYCGRALMEHSSAVRELSFSFDGAYLVAGSSTTDAREGTPGMEVWHVDTGDVVHTVDTVNPVTVAAWHPFRYWLAYAGDPGGLKIVGAGSSV